MAFQSRSRYPAAAPPYQDNSDLRKARQELLKKIESFYCYPSAPKSYIVEHFITDIKTICAIANSENAQDEERLSPGGYLAAIKSLIELFYDIAGDMSLETLETRIPKYTLRLNRLLRRFLLPDDSISGARLRLGLNVDDSAQSEDGPRSIDVFHEETLSQGSSSDEEEEEEGFSPMIDYESDSDDDMEIMPQTPPYHPMSIQQRPGGAIVARQNADFVVRHGESIDTRVGPSIQSTHNPLDNRYKDFSVFIDTRNNTYINEGGSINIQYGAVFRFD